MIGRTENAQISISQTNIKKSYHVTFYVKRFEEQKTTPPSQHTVFQHCSAEMIINKEKPWRYLININIQIQTMQL